MTPTPITAKEARKAERMKPHGWDVGQILYCSWGYDQTNVDFFQVVEVPGPRTVVIRKIAQKATSASQGSERVRAVPDNFIGEPMRKTVNWGGVKIYDFRGGKAYAWDGQDKHQTAAGWGH